MQAQPPHCPRCGAIATNPAATHCQFCQSPLGASQAQRGYENVAPAYAPPAPQGYGAPNPYAQPYYPQQPYAPPPGPYPGYGPAYPPPVQPFGQPYYVPQTSGSGWNNFWSIFWLVRLGIALFVIGIMVMGACIGAISH